ncbi:MAG: ParA family protein [Steroidobacteraceae bacterium]
MRILAVTNIKGGVGKTTTAVNLAWLSAQANGRTVLWDLDPQGAATWTLRCEPHENAGVRKLISGKRELPELLVHTTWPTLDVIPADFSYRKFDLALSEKKNPTERLMRMSRPLSENYDTLFLDCPPGATLLTENVLRAADGVIVPVLPTPLSLRMLRQLQEFIGEHGWTDLRLLPFFSMVDRRKSLHIELIEQLRAEHPLLLTTEVPYASDIERMTMRRAPLCSYAPRSPAGQVYSALWAEIEARLSRP